MKKRLISGIQATGNMHLGNYLGMIKNVVKLQEKFDAFLFIADLHSLTIKRKPEELKQSIIDVTRHYLASGLDPEKVTFFAQSSLHEHSELCWILTTFTQMGEMDRMTQFKDKSKQHKENINVGLFAYPILQAADILLYDVDIVPVGEDQKQHIEITRTIAKRFNNRYKKDVFKLPKPEIKKKNEGGRIMGLDDPSKKMSKSAESALNYISLEDDVEVSKKKIMKAATDSGSEIKFHEDKPGISNLLTINSLIEDVSIKELEARYKDSNYGTFKKELSEKIGDFLTDYRSNLNKFDDNQIAEILAKGAMKAKKIAEVKIAEVKKTVGLI